MNINISGIDVQINKKNIKNMHLSVKPPLGNVVVSAPLLMSQKSIENFVRLNFGWIKKQQEKFANQPRMTARQYVSGETYYIWGKQFFLEFKPSQKRAFKIDGNKIILEMKAESTSEQRERIEAREKYELEKIEEEKREKYNPNEVFKNDKFHEVDKNVENNEKNLPIEVKRDKFFERLLNFLKKFFFKK